MPPGNMSPVIEFNGLPIEPSLRIERFGYGTPSLSPLIENVKVTEGLELVLEWLERVSHEGLLRVYKVSPYSPKTAKMASNARRLAKLGSNWKRISAARHRASILARRAARSLA